MKTIRVLIVDDSVVLRRMLVRILEEDPIMDVVGSARNGLEALEKIAKLQPDVVTMDVEMPEMDGLESLRLIQERHPRVKVIMCSCLTERGARVTVDALMAGASDYVTKVQGSEFSVSILETLGAELRGKIRGMCGIRSQAPAVSMAAATLAAPVVRSTPPGTKARAKILAIGLSTGGPAALADIMPQIPRGFPLPIVIVQHMPAFFTKLLAQRLTKLSQIQVLEAESGMKVMPGTALLAPGDFHMRLVHKDGAVVVALDQEERENSCRPAVDVLFRSVAEIYGGEVLVTILTGMGQDGLLGVKKLKELGASVLVQDENSSVVWGMPGAIVKADLADAVLPLGNLIPEVLKRTCS